MNKEIKNRKLYQYLNKIDGTGANDFYKKIEKELLNGKKKYIVTANPEILMNGLKNDVINRMLLGKDTIIIPDGIGVVKASNLLNKENKILNRNTGIDFVNYLLYCAEKNHFKVFIYGTKQIILDDFKKRITREFPNMQLVYWNGYDFTDEEIEKKIEKEIPDIILVALGTPHQELFIDKVGMKIEKGICVGVGGSIDVLSGVIERAPAFFIDNNLEWLYRITREPKRLGRFVKNNITFMLYILRIKLFMRKNNA